MRPHPFAASLEELRRVAACVESRSLDEASEGVLTLRLPVLKTGPAPSDQLGILAGIEPDGSPMMLAPFRLPTLRLPAGPAFEWLRALLDRTSDASTPIGAGAAYLADVADLVERLLLDQRFVPSVYQMPGGRLKAAWVPWLHDPPASTRVSGLLGSMPPVVRAEPGGFNHQPWLILTHAIAGMVEATVRRILAADNYAEALEGRDAESDAAVAVLGGLLDRSDAVRVNGSAGDVFRDVRMWLGRLIDANQSAAYRLGLRVLEPDMAEVVRAGDERWRVEALLDPRDGVGERIDVADLWRRGAERLPLRCPVDDAQDFVLREIARIQLIDERLRDLVQGASASSIALTTRQVYEFLRDTAPVLEEAGVRILAPEWWGRTTGRLGLRLVLAHDEPAGGAGGDAAPSPQPISMGLNTLVRYEWQVSVGDRPLSAEDVLRLAREKSPLVRLGGQWVEVRPEDLEAARDLLSRGASGEMTIAEAMRAAHGLDAHAPRLPVVGIRSSGWIADLLEGRFASASLMFIDQPASFVGSLRPYQKAGLSWLAFLDAHGLGACLADDMGLGKTIQLIALLLHERNGVGDEPSAVSRQPSGEEERGSGRAGEREDGEAEERSHQPPVTSHPLSPQHPAPGTVSIGPTLIVAPMSVAGNWMREIHRFGPSLRVHVHHGLDRPTHDAFLSLARSVDVIITTYGLVSRDVETLRRVPWRRIVLDEAQYVKNTPTKQAQAIRSLSAERRIALTGTPVENRLSELWSIMEFCNPGYLGSSGEFRRRFALPIERHRDRERAEALRAVIRPFVLRRLKTDPEVVPDLPDLVETKEFASLTPEQAAMYEQVVAEMLSQADRVEGMQRRGLVLAGIVRLKQICNHPANVAPDDEQESDGEIGGDVVGLAGRSGKVRRLLDLLDEVVAAGDKALLFTQYRRMGHLLSRIIRHELGAPVQFLHGGTPRGKRQELIDHFQRADGRPMVFILSLRAGGVGLNLTAANHVIHFDRWWNPAVENQATDRAFRIGQTRTVHVHKLICSGTLEERIDEMLEAKTDLADRIVGSGDAWLTELSTGQLRDILTLRATALEGEE
ncbi:MAG: DEAD/DEAH box helicase [Phycisphaeraceae bacterium]|nr:MAG: DEAD/DEAH box helicase [Phycisphaeraceae bacterium]